ncbi:MAG: Wzz/FepE/Etk N-terminal domain-containing protein [Ignavibacteriales bacterium]|nr:Wzz/FepE/Etk N-terminal domain-containing protein [Ignavibacteriales bacterium]
MAENIGLSFFDYLIIIIKWKKFLISLAVVVAVLSYLGVYFLIPPQYDATAVIVPSEQDQMGGITSLLKSFSNLPVSIPGLKKSTSTDIYKTIIYSRTSMEKLIEKFGLYKEYGYHTMDETINEARSHVFAEETKENAYEITVRASSPKKAEEMSNFLVDQLNSTIIEMDVRKSKENKEFLANRYSEIKDNLKNSEDSLTRFQQATGILMAEDQTKASIEAYTKLEADLAAKQTELSIVQKLYGQDSPQAYNSKISVTEYENKLNKIKAGTDGNNLFLAIKNLPSKAMNYLRRYRDVKINQAMLEFIIPLYEQARFEEQKNIPFLQIIDHAKAPEKKAYPKRFTITIVITAIIMFIMIFVVILREVAGNSDDPKVKFVRNNLFSFRTKKI